MECLPIPHENMAENNLMLIECGKLFLKQEREVDFKIKQDSGTTGGSQGAILSIHFN